MSAAEVKTKISEAVALHEAGDTARAIVKLRSARMLLSAIPNIKHSDGDAIEWRIEDIDKMIVDMRSAIPGVNTIQTQKISYARVTD